VNPVTSGNKKSTEFIVKCGQKPLYFAGGAECFGAISITQQLSSAFRFASKEEAISVRDSLNRIYGEMYWTECEVEEGRM